ncbi:hypothetical protein WN943_005894 [Citrus x changshan-huyou]
MLCNNLSHNSYYNLVEFKKPNLGNLVKKLINLKELALGGVTISTPIPHSLANQSSLTFSSLLGCELRGIIPSLLGDLTKLMYLDLSFNNLLGELPTSIENLDYLKRLDISWNKLSGELQASIGNLASLEQLELSLNRFRGKIPHLMGNFTQLYWDLRFDQLIRISASTFGAVCGDRKPSIPGSARPNEGEQTTKVPKSL